MADEKPRRPSRAAWGSISRDQVLETALRMLRTHGYEQITIRAIANEMGVAPMSLYRHIRDKDDILDEVVDRLLARQWRPRSETSDWKEWVGEAADRLHRFLVDQPAALHVFLDHPVVSPSNVARMQAMMEVLREELCDEEAAGRAYGAIQTYTIGFAALEAARAGWVPPDGDENPVARQLASYTTPRQFSVGLGYLLAGIEREAAAASPSPP
ncbi:MAG TPA: TetR/AcrR family transcriptional regulator [Acidimicrobiales bacterium]|nr:TetR/AcrR family transcriptional regulator [Acidimicrobiales bacterium]